MPILTQNKADNEFRSADWMLGIFHDPEVTPEMKREAAAELQETFQNLSNYYAEEAK